MENINNNNLELDLIHLEQSELEPSSNNNEVKSDDSSGVGVNITGEVLESVGVGEFSPFPQQQRQEIGGGSSKKRKRRIRYKRDKRTSQHSQPSDPSQSQDDQDLGADNQPDGGGLEEQEQQNNDGGIVPHFYGPSDGPIMTIINQVEDVVTSFTIPVEEREDYSATTPTTFLKRDTSAPQLQIEQDSSLQIIPQSSNSDDFWVTGIPAEEVPEDDEEQAEQFLHHENNLEPIVIIVQQPEQQVMIVEQEPKQADDADTLKDETAIDKIEIDTKTQQQHQPSFKAAISDDNYFAENNDDDEKETESRVKIVEIIEKISKQVNVEEEAQAVRPSVSDEFDALLQDNLQYLQEEEGLLQIEEPTFDLLKVVEQEKEEETVSKITSSHIQVQVDADIESFIQIPKEDNSSSSVPVPSNHDIEFEEISHYQEQQEGNLDVNVIVITTPPSSNSDIVATSAAVEDDEKNENAIVQEKINDVEDEPVIVAEKQKSSSSFTTTTQPIKSKTQLVQEDLDLISVAPEDFIPLIQNPQEKEETMDFASIKERFESLSKEKLNNSEVDGSNISFNIITTSRSLDSMSVLNEDHDVADDCGNVTLSSYKPLDGDGEEEYEFDVFDSLQGSKDQDLVADSESDEQGCCANLGFRGRSKAKKFTLNKDKNRLSFKQRSASMKKRLSNVFTSKDTKGGDKAS